MLKCSIIHAVLHYLLAFKLRKVTLLTCILHAECTMLCVNTEVEGSTCHTCGHAVTMLCASTEVEGTRMNLSECHGRSNEPSLDNSEYNSTKRNASKGSVYQLLIGTELCFTTNTSLIISLKL